MALSKDLSAPYAPTTAILGLLERSRAKGLPSPIDKDALLRMGISDSLAPRTLQALQVLDLVSDDGAHTETLERLRAAPESDYQSQMAAWLNAAYADVLQYVDPSEGDETAVRDALRPYKPHSMQDRMLTLFTGLFGAAGVWPEDAQRARMERPKVNSSGQEKKERKPKTKKHTPPPPPPPPPPNPRDISEKALEYRLVDLLGVAAGDEEVMSAIIKVITFLKVKDLKIDVEL